MEIQDYMDKRAELAKKRDKLDFEIGILDDAAEEDFGVSENSIVSMDKLVKLMKYVLAKEKK